VPPSYRYTKIRLNDIVCQLDPAHRNVVEFRHASWWNEDVYSAFRKADIIFCSCSGPRLPDELGQTADEIYVRLHGPKRWYRHDYPKTELAIWADRITASGAKRAWVYFNNDNDTHAPKNAITLRRVLGRVLTLLTAIASATKRIGLIATASTSYTEPYNLARLFASLDHISGGRAGWNIVTTSSPQAAQNFGLPEHPPHGERYERPGSIWMSSRACGTAGRMTLWSTIPDRDTCRHRQDPCDQSRRKAFSGSRTAEHLADAARQAGLCAGSLIR
jgi:hypothetical protein